MFRAGKHQAPCTVPDWEQLAGLPPDLNTDQKKYDKKKCVCCGHITPVPLHQCIFQYLPGLELIYWIYYLIHLLLFKQFIYLFKVLWIFIAEHENDCFLSLKDNFLFSFC